MNKHNRVKAREVMSQSFIQLDRMQTTREALKAMRDNNTEVIIVKKRDRHDAYGILLLSDITKKVLAQDRSLDRVNIYEVMSKPVVSVPPEMDVRYCARLFERFGLSCTPVIESEEILGLIGYRELFDKAYLNIE